MTDIDEVTVIAFENSFSPKRWREQVRKVLFEPFRFPVGFNRHQEVDCKGANQIAREFRVVQRYNRIESSAPQSSGPRSGFGPLR
jgi:hypothetical protein